jgi:NAD(P)-dependent dehydrogenase (short-subunit alcohol dehydrogenase family)
MLDRFGSFASRSGCQQARPCPLCRRKRKLSSKYCGSAVFGSPQLLASAKTRIKLDFYQYVDNNQTMNKIALITGATRNLGFSLAQGLARRLDPTDIVYLTGRDAGRVAQSLKEISGARAQVRGEVLDVSKRDAVARFADDLADRYGGVDLVFSNHYTRIQPEDNPADVIDYYVETNNLGTTNVLRSFAPLLRDGGRLLVIASRAGSLRALAPALHPRFQNLTSLDEVDRAVCRWRDAVRTGRAPGQAWPAWINIPSKIGQVAAVRVLAAERRAQDLSRGVLIASISPGLIDTGASRPWLDLTNAPQPDEVAGPLMDFALSSEFDEQLYGELVHVGREEPGASFGHAISTGSIVPWQ